MTAEAKCPISQCVLKFHPDQAKSFFHNLAEKMINTNKLK